MCGTMPSVQPKAATTLAVELIEREVTSQESLEQAFSERVMRLVMLGDPEFDGLRAEPRYRRLLDRLRLPSGPM